MDEQHEHEEEEGVHVMSDDERYKARRKIREREREYGSRVADQASIENSCTLTQRWWFEDFKRKHGLL